MRKAALYRENLTEETDMAEKFSYEPITFKRIELDKNPVDNKISAKSKKGARKEKALLSDLVTAPEAKVKRKRTLKYISRTVVVACVAFAILFRYISVMDNTNEISRLKAKYADLTEDNINIQCEIDSKTDSDSIEAAAEKLGMSQPSKSQKISVDIKSDDLVEVSDSDDNKKAEAPSQFYATMIETLGNIQEYLY